MNTGTPAPKSDSDAFACTRRDFIRQLAMGGTAMFIFGNLGCSLRLQPESGNQTAYAMIVADYGKCTGCRTCEAVCAAHNHPVIIDGKKIKGLGNPHDANIRIHHFNPPVDVAAVCALCPDAPCIEACPVDPDPATGRKALFRDRDLHTIQNDPDRCIGCRSCETACREERLGVIAADPETGRPLRMCTLCDGKPQCVAHCPYEALSFRKGRLDSRWVGLSPEKIAFSLTQQWYGGLSS